MSKSEARSIFGQGYFQIDKRELAQAVGACLFDPIIVRKGKEGLFEDPYYKSIFNSTQIGFYLSKYWLMKQIQISSKGYPERAYAKWLVLNFAWYNLKTIIEYNSDEKTFRYICEHKDYDALSSLHKILDNIFKAAIKFYKLNKGKGESAKDISSFFQLTKLDSKFNDFWNLKDNNYKSVINLNITKFKTKLKNYEID